MYTQRKQQPVAKVPSRGNGSKGSSSFTDNRPESTAQLNMQQAIPNSPQSMQLKAFQEMADKNDQAGAIQAKPIQLYSYARGTTRNVTITGAGGKSKVFEECTKNSVEYKKGESLVDGSVTGEASWKGWLTNKKGGNTATQLHVVNKLWGGLGGANDGNILPGTPAENSHHLHQAENRFKECFDGSKKAKEDCKYVCTATPKYGQAVDISGGPEEYGDPTLSCDITYNGHTTNYPVTDGAEGLVFSTP